MKDEDDVDLVVDVGVEDDASKSKLTPPKACSENVKIWQES